jgi:hypothetical protein
MKTCTIFSFLLCSLLSGCVVFSSKRPELTVSTKSKIVISDFCGVYNDISESTNGVKRSLASVLGIYSRPPAPDSVVITVSSAGELFGDAMLDSAVLSRSSLSCIGPLGRGKLPLGAGRVDAGGFFSSGVQCYSSYLYVTKKGDLALHSSSTFSGTFLIFPAYAKGSDIYVWKRK